MSFAFFIVVPFVPHQMPNFEAVVIIMIQRGSGPEKLKKIEKFEKIENFEKNKEFEKIEKFEKKLKNSKN